MTASRVSGVGDILLNYRYQLLYEGDSKPAVAPRFSLILPTGNRKKGTGNNVVGYQLNLPVSKKISDTVALHVNVGATFLPHVKAPVDINGNSAKKSLTSANIGGSAIYALFPRFHLMLGVGRSTPTRVLAIPASVNARSCRRCRRVFGRRSSIEDKLQIVTGAAMPIGLNRKTDNLGAFLYLSIEHDLF